MVAHFFGRKANGGSIGDNGSSSGSEGNGSRRDVLLKYVREVQPLVMEQFSEQAPASIVGAMRQTISNMLGTLPPEFFEGALWLMHSNICVVSQHSLHFVSTVLVRMLNAVRYGNLHCQACTVPLWDTRCNCLLIIPCKFVRPTARMASTN